MPKKLPTIVHYISLRGLLGYEDNTPEGYTGEVEYVYIPYALKDMPIKTKEQIESNFKKATDKNLWENLLRRIENTVILGIKNSDERINKISWSVDTRTGKDLMRITTDKNKNYSFVAELLYKVLEVKEFIKT